MSDNAPANGNVAVIGIALETDGLETGKLSLARLAELGPAVEASMQRVEAGTTDAGRAVGTLGAQATVAGSEIRRSAGDLGAMATQMTNLSSASARARASLASIGTLGDDVRVAAAELRSMSASLASLASSNAAAAEAAAKRQATDAASANGLQDQARAARASAAAIGEKAIADARAASSADAFIASLKRQAETMGLTRRQLLEYQAAQLGVGGAAQPYISQLTAMDGATRRFGVTAGQTANAFRVLPAQITDVVTQLAGGQNPLLILIQQGGQVKDSFGGIGPALRAVGSLITPTVAALAALAAVVGTAALSFYQGQSEAREYANALILTGNAAGKTVDQLSGTAAAIARITGSQRGAADALAQIAATGRVAGSEFEGLARAAQLFEKATGTAVSATVANLVRLADEPARASAKLNESLHYLTASTYERIASLEQQGQKEEAAALAQRTYAQAIEDRAKQVKASLGSLESAWAAIGQAASSAWNAMLNIGRPETIDNTIAKLQGAINARVSAGPRAASPFVAGESRSDFDAKTAAMQEQLALLKKEQTATAELAATQAKTAATQAAGVDAVAKITAGLDSYTTKQSKLNRMNRELAETRKLYDDLRKADPNSKLLDREQESLAGVREKYKDAAGKSAAEALAKDVLEAQVVAAKASAEFREAIDRSYVAHATEIYRQGARSQFDFIDAVAERELDALSTTKAALEEQYRLTATKLTDKSLGDDAASKLNARKELAELSGKIAVADERISSRRVKQLDDENAAFIANQAIRESLYETALKGADALEKQLVVARQEGEEIGAKADLLAALRVARQLETAATIDARAAVIATIAGREEETEQLKRQAQSIRELAVAKELNESRKAFDELFDPSRAQTFGEAIAEAFRGAGSAIAGVGKAIGEYQAKQAKLSALALQDLAATRAAVKAANASGDYATGAQLESEGAARAAKLAEASTRSQIALYTDAAGAAKGFFKEGSTGYKTLQAAQQAFQAYQLASDLIAGASKAAVAIANQATSGDPYTALFRMGAMAAAMASLGFAVAGGFNTSSGGRTSAAEQQATQNRGTVLGDASATSSSISKSYEQLLSTSKAQLTAQGGMLTALRSIDNSMKGLATILLRTNGLTAGNSFGVQTGTLSTNKGDYLLGQLGINDSVIVKALNFTISGKILGALQSLFGKVTQEITDSGLAIAGKVSDLTQGRGVQQYADVKTTSSSFFGLVKKESSNTLYGAVDPNIAKQFGLVFAGISDALTSAAGALGKDASTIGRTVADFIVDIPRESLRGLTGTALQDAVDALISSVADTVAKATSGGLEEFQTIGEGYFQTVVRVSSGVETATAALEKFGVTTVSLASVVNKQADVATELFRQSVVAAETRSTRIGVNLSGTADREGLADSLSGVGQIIRDLAGSVDDLASAYASLTSLRDGLRSVGQAGDALTAAMLRGAGSIDALKSGVDTYFDKFFTAPEKAAAKTARLAEQFSKLGLAIPTSNAGFRTLVQGIDVTTAAGQQLYGQVLGLAAAFADLYPLAESTEDASKSLADAWRSITDSLLDEVQRIRGLLSSQSGGGFANLQAQFVTKTAAARAGDQDAAKALPGVSQALLEAAKAVATTSTQYRAIQATTATSLEATAALAQMWATAQASTATPATAATGTAAPTTITSTIPAAAAPAVPTAGLAPMLVELQALREQVESLNDQVRGLATDQRTGHSRIAANTDAAARTLARVVGTDGVSIAVSTRVDDSVVTST